MSVVSLVVFGQRPRSEAGVYRSILVTCKSLVFIGLERLPRPPDSAVAVARAVVYTSIDDHQQKPEWLILGSERRRATQSLPIGGERAHSSVIIFHSSIIAQSAREPIAIACNRCARRWLSWAIAPLVFECALAKGRSRQDACRAMGRAGRLGVSGVLRAPRCTHIMREDHEQ